MTYKPRIEYSIERDPSDDFVINLNHLRLEVIRSYLNINYEDLLWLISPEDIDKFSQEIKEDSSVSDLYLKIKDKEGEYANKIFGIRVCSNWEGNPRLILINKGMELK